MFGNLQPQHVEKRKQALEAYLETLLDSFQTELPPELQEFIEVNKYVSDSHHKDPFIPKFKKYMYILPTFTV